LQELKIAPAIRARNASAFLISEEGNDAIRFINEYIHLGHIARPDFSRLLYDVRRRLLDSGQAKTMVLARMCELEIVSGLYMTSEDIAAFCLAFERPLEEIPRAVVNMSTARINEFYSDVSSWSDKFYHDLWLNVEPSKFDLPLREWTGAIQNQNVKFTKFILDELAVFRSLHSRLHNKYKHCFPIWIRYLPGQGPEDRECSNVVFALDNEIEPVRNLKAFIVGEHLVERLLSLHQMAAHLFEALLRTRLNWIRDDCKVFPKTVVYGRNPLNERDWADYTRIVRELQPKPLAPWPIVPKLRTISTDVASQYKWIHSASATSEWLVVRPTRFFLKE
jgi:hypothetical protein